MFSVFSEVLVSVTLGFFGSILLKLPVKELVLTTGQFSSHQALMLNGRVLISMRAFIWYSLSKRTQKRLLANLNIGKQEAMNKARCLSHRLESNC